MARLTKAQREWRPGMPRKRRSVRVQFASVLLLTEAFVAFFAMLVVFGLRGREYGPGLVLGVGLGFVAVLVLACAVVKRPWGMALAWFLQLVLIAAGFVEPMMFVVGALMALAWWYAVRTGTRLDRENVKREREQAEWERAHPEAGGEAPEGEGQTQ
jgi:MFS family permease